MENKDKKRVFITGATGFVGSHLLSYCLMKGYAVFAMRRACSSMVQVEYVSQFYGLKSEDLAKVVWRECDMLDTQELVKAMEGCVVLFHCAADVGLGGVDMEKMREANVDGTRSALSAAKMAGVCRVCCLSSIAALGNAEEGRLIDEYCEWNDKEVHSQYAVTKRIALQEALSAASDTLSVVAVCPGPILGVSAVDRSSAQIIYLAKRGVPFSTNGGSGYVDVRDVCEALVRLSETEDNKMDYYVLAGYNVTNTQLLAALARGFHRWRPIPLPDSVIRTVACVAEWCGGILRCKVQLDRSMARTLTHRSYCDGSRYRKEFSAEYIPLERSVRDICGFMRKKNKNIDSNSNLFCKFARKISEKRRENKGKIL